MQINPKLIQSTHTGSPSFLEDQFKLDWSMTRNEQYALLCLLQKIKPKIAIEIGTYNGGSLQVISRYSEKVYAIDIDSTIPERLGNQFENVEFLIGDSKTIVPKLLKDLREQNQSVDFVLIDGDHSFEGVKNDIESFLSYKPKESLHIILHDSFNPACRAGMKAPNYNFNNYIHYIELDFISGVFSPDGLKRQMWGGFALILFLNKERNSNLTITESQKDLFKITYKRSIYYLKNQFVFLNPIYRKLKNRL